MNLSLSLGIVGDKLKGHLQNSRHSAANISPSHSVRSAMFIAGETEPRSRTRLGVQCYSLPVGREFRLASQDLRITINLKGSAPKDLCGCVFLDHLDQANHARTAHTGR